MTAFPLVLRRFLDRKSQFALWISVVFKFAFSIFVLAKICSLDIFPVMTADSGQYVSEVASAKYVANPLAVLAPRHFKTAGYPIYLTALNSLKRLTGLDLLTLAALSQRALLAVAVGWLIFELGLASLPLALFFSSNELLAQANFILTEGLTVPLCIIFALMVLRIYRRRNAPGVLRSWSFWFDFSLLVATFTMLFLTKLPLVALVLTLIPLIAGRTVANAPTRFTATRVAAPVICLCALPVFYCLVISIDNYRALGTFTPTAGTDRIAYWATWETVFTDSPRNRVRPELGELYDRGDPYRFIHGVEEKCGGLTEFNCSRDALRRRTRELIETAGLSLGRARLVAFGKGLLGGGKFELAAKRAKVVWMSGRDDEIDKSMRALMQRFGDALPKDRPPAVIQGAWRANHKSWRLVSIQYAMTGILLAAFFAVFTLRLIRKRDHTDNLSLFSLLNYVLLCAAFGWMLCDVWRYVLPGWAAFATIQTAWLASMVQSEIQGLRLSR